MTPMDREKAIRAYQQMQSIIDGQAAADELVQRRFMDDKAEISRLEFERTRLVKEWLATVDLLMERCPPTKSENLGIVAVGLMIARRLERE